MNREFPSISVPRSPNASSERTMEGVFTKLYDNDTWNLYLAGEPGDGQGGDGQGGGEQGGDGQGRDGGDGDTSRSGNGSNLTQTATLRSELPGLLARLGVRTLLDIPCGDFYWMSRLDLGTDTHISYIGADRVPAVGDRNTPAFARPGPAFRLRHLTPSSPPPGAMVVSP
ncbi:hypothetical protein ACFU99_40805, partial [Streptomyces sp. NPDC057654]